MIPEKFHEVLKNEGVVSIVTQGKNEPHVVNTWNSYIKLTKENEILIPVGNMNTTEDNIKNNNNVHLTLGSKEVQGLVAQGTGFLIKGTAVINKDGSTFNTIKESFPWARASLVIKIDNIQQTI